LKEEEEEERAKDKIMESELRREDEKRGCKGSGEE
jgi:hypothetical protein